MRKESIAALVKRREELKDEEKDIAAEVELIDAQLREYAAEGKTEMESDGYVYSFTDVASSTSRLDEDKLRKSIGVRMWNAVTKRVLDEQLVAKALAEGRIKAATVDKCYEYTPKRPYIRTSKRKVRGAKKS